MNKPSHNTGPWQFTVRDVLLLTAMIGVILAVARLSLEGAAAVNSLFAILALTADRRIPSEAKLIGTLILTAIGVGALMACVV